MKQTKKHEYIMSKVRIAIKKQNVKQHANMITKLVSEFNNEYELVTRKLYN